MTKRGLVLLDMASNLKYYKFFDDGSIYIS